MSEEIDTSQKNLVPLKVQASEVEPRREFDSGWKIVLGSFLQQSLSLVWKPMHDAIDWSKGYNDLDKEFDAALSQADLGEDLDRSKQFVDKLFQVHFKSGEKVHILLHIEVQTKAEENFEQRMFNYLVAIKARTKGVHVEQVAIFLDKDLHYIPNTYRYPQYSFARLEYQFKIIKIAEWKDKITFENLGDEPRNIFRAVVLMQLMTMYPKKGEKRLFGLMKFFVALRDAGFSRAEFSQAMDFAHFLRPVRKSEEQEWKEFVELETMRSESWKGEIMDAYQQYRFDKGKAEGIAEGELKAKVKIFRALVAEKFSEARALEIAGLSEQDLEAGKKLLEADSGQFGHKDGG